VRGKDPLTNTIRISQREGTRGSDEAIVSRDPAGQNNPRASQGPLDGIVKVRGEGFRLDALLRPDHGPKAPLRDRDFDGV
jgi:hypothetical protein